MRISDRSCKPCLDLHTGTQTFLAVSFVLHLKEMIHFCGSASNSDMDEGALKTRPLLVRYLSVRLSFVLLEKGFISARDCHWLNNTFKKKLPSFMVSLDNS